MTRASIIGGIFAAGLALWTVAAVMAIATF